MKVIVSHETGAKILSDNCIWPNKKYVVPVSLF